ncbi:probable methyltransferase PMT25 isoform X2 [Rhodamnia argentea]|uniref:Probable methyltransferase PMT25 isoform X2 n=1 Tax=Rhodamnia argentea TaxID=178133 RepID=A0ABM3H0P6_9MYRT|nr:probable methyltransferase PMT25 isoform X2 [Rhodamnia argentea]
MASRNIPLFDVRKSAKNGLRLPVVVFVAVSLFAIWIFLPSSPTFPVANPDLLYQENDTLGHRVTNGSLRNTQIQSQDVPNDDKRTVEKNGSDDAGEQTEFDSANTVETDLEEDKSEESTPGKTSSEKTSDISEMTSELDNETEDRQKNNYNESNESREEQNTGMSSTEGGQKDGEQTMDDAASDLDEKFNGSKGSDSDMVDSAEKLNAEDSLDDVKQDNKEVNQNTKRVQQDHDKNSEKTAANNILEIQEQNEKLSQQDSKEQNYYTWKVCNTTAGPDYIPCLDNVYAVRRLPSIIHFEHRERHCPENGPMCLVPLPAGYRKPIQWPISRDKIWFRNVPHSELAVAKGHQNWVKVTGEYLTFPGGGTQFVQGALHYIDMIQNANPAISWGKRTRVILDVGCGVASFGGYLFERDVLAMSFAPKDVHEAQVQFALERGIPAILGVMGSKRLPFPGGVFDVIHCARCRVPWHVEGGKLLLELNRVLRPGGYFVWSATPIYRRDPEDAGIWKEMSKLTMAMCWDLVVIKKDKLNKVAIAMYRKPTSNECYDKRPQNAPPLCNKFDDPNSAWNVTLQACMHKVPVDMLERGSKWPEKWPVRLENPPYWLNEVGVHGKPSQEDFTADYKHWKDVVSHTYLNGIGVRWSSIRNVMDMKAVYGGFAAVLKDLKLWVMNVIPIESPDTLPIIYERGLFGMYHDWCESFNTYPRSYDLLHADNLFSSLKRRCNLMPVFAEVDRILRPEGILIVRDDVATIAEIESIAKSLQWDVIFTHSKDNEGLLSVQKTFWRPLDVETITSAIA